MHINPSRLTIGCNDAVDVCRALEWAAYANTQRSAGSAIDIELSPLEFQLPDGCGNATNCCCTVVTGAQSPRLTGAAWVDPIRPVSFSAFGAVIEDGILSGVDNSDEYELTVTLVPYATTQEAILYWVRWLRDSTDFCGGWPDIAFVEHCIVTTRIPVCADAANSMNAVLPDTGNRTMVDAKLITFKEDLPQFNGKVWVTRVTITWRGRVPLIADAAVITPVNLQTANPQPTVACLYDYHGVVGSAPRRRYLVGNPIDFADPESIRNPVWFRLGCIPVAEMAAVDVTIDNTRSSSMLANLRVELRSWDPRQGAPTTTKLRKALSEELPCAVALVGRVGSGETVCISSSRHQILASRGGETLEEIGTVLGNLGGSMANWLILNPKRAGEEWVLVAWPSGEQHPVTSAEFTPAAATISIAVTSLRGRV